jgi:hypothetical protein
VQEGLCGKWILDFDPSDPKLLVLFRISNSFKEKIKASFGSLEGNGMEWNE